MLNPNDSFTSRAFDEAALSYDDEFDDLPATRRLRAIATREYERIFPGNGSLLELNCGTGTQAILLAMRGYRVTATDLSVRMIERVREKSERAGLTTQIRTCVMGFAEIPRLAGEQFDGAYSDMGGLNCAADLHRVARDLAGVLPSRSAFAASIMTKFCLWEFVSFVGRGEVKSAMRRMSRTIASASVHGHRITVRYYSPRSISKVFKPYFETERVIGLNILTPPPTSTNAFRRLGPLMRILEAADDFFCRIFPFNSIGDHFLVVLRRTDTPVQVIQ